MESFVNPRLSWWLLPLVALAGCASSAGEGQREDTGAAAQRVVSNGEVSLATGVVHTCAVKSDGTVKCWGANESGQLGDGTTTGRSEPAEVSGLRGAVSVAAGNYHSCARTSDGNVFCWGDNAKGQLGNGTYANSLVPVQVVGVSSAVAVSVGDEFSCALTSAGEVKCWGYNGYGQLGNGSTIHSRVPVTVSGYESGVRMISAGFSSACAVTSAGAAECWGLNRNGQLGNGTVVNSHVPVRVTGLNGGVLSVHAGGRRSCAALEAGGFKCWGEPNLGDGTRDERHVPVDVAGIPSVVTSAGAGMSLESACLVTEETGWCWGQNSYGTVGSQQAGESLLPTKVAGLEPGVKVISTGFLHTCAMRANDVVQCWGLNSDGQIGSGAMGDRVIDPTTVVGF